MEMHPPKSLIATVTNICPQGSAFARDDEGNDLFISGVLVERARLELGDSVSALVVPNRKIGSTEFYCLRAFKVPGANDSASLAVTRAMEEGGAWSAEDMAEETGLPDAVVRGLLEAAFRAGKGAKYCRFSSISGGADLVVYSWHPDRIDIAEFDDEEAA